MTSHIFGPVPSRRLGRSLGVDLVPFKTCTYDCAYCQLGLTTHKTIERREWVSLEDVLDELQEKLSSKPDYITLSGSGEPTLSLRLDYLIDRIKEMTSAPVAVLTNGSLLWREDVRRELMHADLVIPSLDAGDEASFRLVNRPHKEIAFARMLEGLIQFRREFRGAYWLEVFVLDGSTATPVEFSKIVGCVKRIQPDRVQLNTVTRPPAEKSAVTVSPRQLAKLASRFDPVAEVIADYHATDQQLDFVASRAEVLDMLRRRPCSIGDMAEGLGMHRNEVIKYVEELDSEGFLKESLVGEVTYFKAASGTDREDSKKG